MPIDFHAQKNRSTYASRNADDTWAEAISNLVAAEGLTVVDVGCGGGIYTKASD